MKAVTGPGGQETALYLARLLIGLRQRPARGQQQPYLEVALVNRRQEDLLQERRAEGAGGQERDAEHYRNQPVA